MFDIHDRLKIKDFFLSTDQEFHDGIEVDGERTGETGTPVYMAPEQMVVI